MIIGFNPAFHMGLSALWALNEYSQHVNVRSYCIYIALILHLYCMYDVLLFLFEPWAYFHLNWKGLFRQYSNMTWNAGGMVDLRGALK